MSQPAADMNGKPPAGGSEEQGQLEELSATVAQNEVDIAALQTGAERATDRADASDNRVTEHGTRMDTLETRFDLDREIIGQLQADGLLSEEHAAHLEQALRSSRKIGAAIGIVMAERKVTEDAAYNLLRQVSQDTHRKMTVLAIEIVDMGDTSALPPL